MKRKILFAMIFPLLEISIHFPHLSKKRLDILKILFLVFPKLQQFRQAFLNL